MKRILTAAALTLTLGAPIAAHADDSVALVTAWQALNEDCRGGLGDDQRTKQPWKRNLAARDFQPHAPGIAPANCRPPTETGPWRGKLRKCRAIVGRRKSRGFARTSWWSGGDSNL
jgi:hypothetical protein